MNTDNHNTLSQLSPDDIILTRELAAPLDLVWRAFTEAEHLANWWGPKGCQTRVLQLDLRPGGLFHYAVGFGKGDAMFGRFVFREIVPQERFVYVLSFSDEAGNITRAPFSENWPLELLCETAFSHRDGKTFVTMAGVPLDATDAERQAHEAGRPLVLQGTSGNLDVLEEYLAQISAR